MDRRSFLKGMAGILASAAAPAIITTPGLLMPVRKIIVPEPMVIPAWNEIADPYAVFRQAEAEYFAQQFDRIYAEAMERLMIYGCAITKNGQLVPMKEQGEIIDRQRNVLLLLPGGTDKWDVQFTQWSPLLCKEESYGRS